MRKARKTLMVMILGVLVLAACAGSTDRPEQAEAPTVSGDDRAPDFEISLYQGDEALGGDALHMSELVGTGKPVVLNFWAGLCPPCRIEMPDLQRVYEARGDEIILIGVDIGPFVQLGSREDGQALVNELGVTYPTGTTFNESVVQAYRVLGMPSTYFITPEGHIWESWAGLLTESKLNELVDGLIAASGG